MTSITAPTYTVIPRSLVNKAMLIAESEVEAAAPSTLPADADELRADARRLRKELAEGMADLGDILVTHFRRKIEES